MGENLLFPSAAAMIQNNVVQSDMLQQNVLNSNEFTSFASTEKFDEKSWHASSINPEKDNDSSDASSLSSNWESDESRVKKRKKEKKKRKKKHRKKHSREKKQPKLERVSKPDTIWLENTNLDASDAFRKDKRADRNNAEFDSLYKMDVAMFRAHFEWTCLGLSNKQSISLYPNKRKRKKNKVEKARYFLSGNHGVLDIDDGDTTFVHSTESQEFIPLARNPVKRDAVIKQGVELSQYVTDSYTEGSKKFSTELLNHPHDIQLWLEFVDFQDNLITASSKNDEEEGLKKTPKAIVEKKLSILDKAITRNPTSIELILKYAHLVKEIWSSSKVNEQWKGWLFKFPNCSLLWQEYLLYVQSDLVSMTLSSVVKAYKNCFRTLLGIYTGTLRTHKPEENAEEALLVVLLQFVIFLWRAGCSEKAVCILQCMIEFNLNTPHDSHENLKQKKERFEVFFESDEPRFSEDGWSARSHSPPSSTVSATLITCTTFSTPTFDEVLEEKKKTLREKIWTELEIIREMSQFEPFRGCHDDCEDTDRIVLYDDISFALFNLPSPDLMFQLLISFLLLLGVPIPKRMLSKDVLNCFSKYFYLENATGVCLCHSTWRNSHVSLKSILLTEVDTFNAACVGKARKILSQSLSLFEERYVKKLSQIWFHFETMLFRKEIETTSNQSNCKTYGKEIKKFVKSVLKLPPNRNCVALWDMYAMYEWKLGRHDDAKKIYFTTLRLCSTKVGKRHFRISSSVRSMIDLHLLDSSNKEIDIRVSSGIKKQVLQILCAFVTENELDLSINANTVDLLKVCSLLKSEHAQLLNKRDLLNSKERDFLCCYIVFEYFFNGFESLHTACKEVLEFSSRTKQHEGFVDIFLHALVLMHSHCKCNYECFSIYKTTLESCFEQYPNNTSLNNLFINVKQHGLDSLHARRFYKNLIKHTEALDPWLHAVEYEEQRLKYVSPLPVAESVSLEFVDAQSGVHNRIRALYQRLLNTEKFRYCADLWIKYIDFQLKFGTEKMARDTFYTSLRSCPGGKILYQLAIDHLNMFKEAYDLMMEKELRVKLIVEELDILLDN